MSGLGANMKRKPLVDWFDGHPLAAAIISFFLPGLPHIAMGEIALGLVFFILAMGSWWFLAGWVIGLIAAFHAHHVAENVYKEEPK